MNKWLFLLIVIGLGAAAWLNRDKISGWLGHKSEEVAEATPAPATPSPAKESRAQAVKAYPSLGVQGSPFNVKFLQNYNAVAATNPAFLAQSDWPMRLAEQTARDLGAGGSTAARAPVSNSSLNHSSGGSTVPPKVNLPGLQGSALDQRPPDKRH